MSSSGVMYSDEEYHQKVEKLLQAATVHLRKVFEARWKLETGEIWRNTPSQRNKFISHFGQKILEKATSIQKRILVNGNIDDWDLTTVSLALLNFGSDTCKSKYKQDNNAVWKLINVRNELAHHPTKRLTVNEYNNKETIIKTALVFLGLSESAVTDVINQSAISSFTKGMELLEKMKSIAENHIESGRFQEAIHVLGEALTIPNLVPLNLSVVYETRANCYLKLTTGWQDMESICKQALKDVDAALELNDRSWNAHYIAAQCYRKQNKLSEALKCYGRALAISPTQKHVMNERDGCKVIAAYESSGDIFDPGLMPTNLREEVDKIQYATGIKITGEELIKMSLNNKYPGSDEEFRGRMYINGWGVPQSLKEAFNCFSRAAEIGYPAGIYNTALCYFHGRGVTQDVAKSRELHLKAANMSPDTPGDTTPLKKNFGVAASQHALGVMYQCGNGVVQNYKTAVEWLEKGVENGFGNSATNLGLIYMEGNAYIPKNTKRAEMYWKQGTSLKSYTSAVFLSKYYIVELEPEMALAAFKTSRILSFDDNVAEQEEEFLLSIQSEIDERQQYDEEVEAFETLHNLDTKGLTFKERLTRKCKYEDPNVVEAIKVCESMVSHITSLGGLCFGSSFNHHNLVRNDTLTTLFDNAANGSSTAKRVVNTILASIALNNLLAKDQPFKKQDKKAIVNFLYECCTEDDDAKMILEDYGDRLMSTIKTLFTTTCGRRGEKDMKIRFCYIAFNLQSSIVTNDTLGIELLKEGIKMYPDNRHYYILLIKWYLSKHALSSAIQIVDQGLKQFPKDFELLLAKATCMRLQNKEPASIVEVYHQYLKEVPKDNRHRPEAYFEIAVLYLLNFNESQEWKDKAKKFYDLGVKAEEDLLKCFLPRPKSSAESILESWLHSENPGALKGIKPIPQKKDMANVQKLPVSILEEKPYLMNPVRLNHIREHRMKILNITTQFKFLKTPDADDYVKLKFTMQPKLRQKPPTSMVNLKPIKLQEMVSGVDTIYENRLIDLTIIDDACFGLTSIHLVAEDSSGDVIFVCLYNEKQDAKAIEKYGFGSRITILNPYMRVGSTGESVIRNDNVRCVIPLDGLENMCRFCGKPDTKLKCGRCRSASYCGKECQEMDWKFLQHKKVCGVKFFGYQ